MSETHTTAANPQDTVRQTVVLVSLLIAIAGALIGSGALGGDTMPEAAGGVFRADATLIAPAGPAFAIWSVIYLGLVGYAIWQFLPAQKASVRHRRLGYPMAASMVLNAVWLLVVQAGFLIVSVVVILALLAVLAVLFVICTRVPPTGLAEDFLVDGVVGLYLGWVCVATAANITAVLVAYEFSGWGLDPELWAAAVVIVAGLVGLALAVYGGGRFTPTAALSWGLVWVAIARLTGEPHSVLTAMTALIAVAVVIAITVGIRSNSRRRDSIDRMNPSHPAEGSV